LEAERRAPAAGGEVEGPRALVVRRTGQPEGDDVLQAEQPPHDDGAVLPRAGAGRDQPVATRLHRVPVRAVTGDPGGDVVGVAGELLAGAHVRTRGGVLVHDPTVTRRGPRRSVEVRSGCRAPPRPARRSTPRCR